MNLWNFFSVCFVMEVLLSVWMCFQLPNESTCLSLHLILAVCSVVNHPSKNSWPCHSQRRWPRLPITVFNDSGLPQRQLLFALLYWYSDETDTNHMAPILTSTQSPYLNLNVFNSYCPSYTHSVGHSLLAHHTATNKSIPGGKYIAL